MSEANSNGPQLSRIDKELSLLNVYVASKRPPAEIARQARKVRDALNDEYSEIASTVRYVDSVVERYAPNEEWQQGMLSLIPPATKSTKADRLVPEAGTKTSRKESLKTAAIRIAEELGGNGATVTTKDIAEKAKSKGDPRPVKTIAISLGNSLVRSGWKKVSRGAYSRKEALQN